MRRNIIQIECDCCGKTEQWREKVPYGIQLWTWLKHYRPSDELGTKPHDESYLCPDCSRDFRSWLVCPAATPDTQTEKEEKP